MRRLAPQPVSWKVPGNVSPAVRAMHFFRHQTHGVILAIADMNGNVHLHDPEREGELVTQRDGRPAGFRAPDGAPVHDLTHLRRPTGWPELVTVRADHRTYRYEIPDGRWNLVGELPDGENLRVVDTLAAADGSPIIAVAGLGDVVHLWRRDAREPQQLRGHTGPVRVLNSLRDERRLAVGDERGITVWDLSGPTPQRVSQFGGPCSSLAVLREHGEVLLVSGARDGVRIWDMEDGRELSHFAQSYRVSSLVTLSTEPGERMLAVASDQAVTLWNPTAEAQSHITLAEVPDGGTPVLAQILTGNVTLLAAGDENGQVAVWRLEPQSRPANLLGNHSDWINSLALVGPPKQPLLASASDDRTARLWDLREATQHGEPIRPHPETQVEGVVPVGHDVAVADWLGRVQRRRIGRDEPIWKRELNLPVRAMASFRAQSGWWIVTGHEGGRCTLWHGRRGAAKKLEPAAADPTAARAVAVAELRGQWYAVAGHLSGRIEVWNAETGTVLWTRAEAHQGEQVRSLAVVYPAGRAVLASGSSAGTIRLWDLATGEQLRSPVQAHGGPVAALCGVRYGESWLLASGGANKDIRLWEPEAMDQPLSGIVNAHERWVRVLAQVPDAVDGSVQLASGGEEGSIRLWQIRDRRLVMSAHRPVIRGFRDRVAKHDLLDREALLTELRDTLSPVGSGSAEPAGERSDAASGPQVVLIQGAWGTGKSSIMSSLRKLLDPDLELPEPTGQGRELSPWQVNRIVRAGNVPPAEPQEVRHTITAWFNPWAHQSSEQVWSGLAWSIVEATRGKLGATHAERQRYWLGRNLQRLDRGALRRSLRWRIWRPLVTTIAFLIAPLALLLVRIGAQTDQRAEPGSGELTIRHWLALLVPGWRDQPDAGPDLLDRTLFDWLSFLLVLALLGVLAVLGSYSVRQYLRGSITAYLPAAIFDGPIDQVSLMNATASGEGPFGERLLRVNPYVGAAGPLHSINQDLHRLIKDLEERGYQLVVFIDDLDRCSSRHTAEVFEAINAFLSDPSFLESAPRFVIGLDSTVVASRLATAYADQSATHPGAEPDDPNLGWATLRKLSQLTVVLPVIRPAHAPRLLRHHSSLADRMHEPQLGGRAEHVLPQRRPDGHRRPEGGSGAVEAPKDGHGGQPAGGDGDDMGQRRPVPQSDPLPVALEEERAVQAHMRQLIELRPRQTMRETMRLLTAWGFYMRLLERLQPARTVMNIQDACDVMTLAEIIRRWPALVPFLGKVHNGPSGLALLIGAARADLADASAGAWDTAITDVGLHQGDYARATTNLRRLLCDHGTVGLAQLANRLL